MIQPTTETGTHNPDGNRWTSQEPGNVSNRNAATIPTEEIAQSVRAGSDVTKIRRESQTSPDRSPWARSGWAAVGSFVIDEPFMPNCPWSRRHATHSSAWRIFPHRSQTPSHGETGSDLT